MKLILVEYLASLRERDELDVIVPDALSELGFNVISRPTIGTRQHGVDVAAVGEGPDGVKTLFLISIKRGNLSREDWSSGTQSLRSSLEEIIEVYVEQQVPKRYSDLPVCIVICLGGEFLQNARVEIDAFTSKHSNDRITFEVWNGDRLADLLLSGILRENALPKTWRNDFRKSVALVDEPHVSFQHFRSLVSSIVSDCKKRISARLTALRQVYLALWTLYVWARQADNIETAYLSSELALLLSWHLIKEQVSKKSKLARQVNYTFTRMVSLHASIADEYIATYIKPRATLHNGLTSAVPSQSSLDINLRLFDIVGRVGARGLWLVRELHLLSSGKKNAQLRSKQAEIQDLAELLADILRTNPILLTPIKDSQAIDISIACTFLSVATDIGTIKRWIHQVVRATCFAYLRHGPYPCIFEDYRDLIDHPKKTEKYRVGVTSGSLLVPTLALWAAIGDDADTLGVLADFVSEHYSHSTLQLWYPGPDSEERFYSNLDHHGLAFTDTKIERVCSKVIDPIRSECAASNEFESLSANKLGLWPLLITACRHHRYPIPPHFCPFPD